MFGLLLQFLLILDRKKAQTLKYATSESAIAFFCYQEYEHGEFASDGAVSVTKLIIDGRKNIPKESSSKGCSRCAEKCIQSDKKERSVIIWPVGGLNLNRLN